MSTPEMVWGFHMFPHNVDDVPLARELAAELEMSFFLEKGVVVGAEWDPGHAVGFMTRMQPFPCLFLWSQSVVSIDGGVAPCCGTFYREDDMGRVALADGDGGVRTFREAWNGERFQQGRAMYRSRATARDTSHICYNCPATLVWERWKQHEATGGDHDTFQPGVSVNDSFNYFWDRRPAGAAAPRRVTMRTR